MGRKSTMSEQKMRKLGRLVNKEVYYKKFEEKYQGKLTILKWIDYNNPVTVRCNECGEKYDMDFVYAIRRDSNTCYFLWKKEI